MRAIALILGTGLLLPALAACASREAPPEEVPANVVVFPGGPVCALDVRGPLAELPQQQLDFIDLIERQGITPVGPLTALFEEDPTGDPALPAHYLLMVRVPEGTFADAPFAVYRMPERRTAAVMVQGPYDHVFARLRNLLDWIPANGWRRAGDLIHVYRQHRAWNIPERKYLTEVHIEVEPAAR